MESVPGGLPARGPVDECVVRRQIGRDPREPWSVATRCRYGFASSIASPPVLADGSRFPTLYWLTCPYLAAIASQAESSGETARWAARASSDPTVAERLRAVDAQLRERRARIAGGSDPCGDVGLAGQRDPLGVKCLHAHLAYALAGIDDPIGCELIARHGNACDDERCAEFSETDECD